jgi:hypothetical protein
VVCSDVVKLTANTAISLFLFSLYKVSKSGISPLYGGHHVEIIIIDKITPPFNAQILLLIRKNPQKEEGFHPVFFIHLTPKQKAKKWGSHLRFDKQIETHKTL